MHFHSESILRSTVSKVPAITLAFWITKIAATTLGETAGDAVSMTLGLGYAVGTAIFAAFFMATLAAQIKARVCHPFLYWAVIVATTTAGTTMADFIDRSLGIGYWGGSALLLAMLVAVILFWQRSCGSVSVESIKSSKAEIFYWLTILLSNTLGTALGDFLAADSGLGYRGSALVFSIMLAVIAFFYAATRISRTVIFWLAFILTRPLGATLGDMLTKSHEQGGLDLSRFSSSAIIGIFMIICILYSSRKTVPATH